MVDARPICETCGHTRDWHDRNAAKARTGSDPGIERPCYREVGGVACPCSGFRDSGTFAMRPGIAFMQTAAPGIPIVRVGLLALLLVVLGLALLYAYRSQTPSLPQVSVSQAGDINSGRVRSVTVTGNAAILEFNDSFAHREQTTVPQPDNILAPAISSYNATHPSQPIALTYAQAAQPLGVIGPIVLSLLPVVLIGAFFYYLMGARRKP